MGAVGRFVGFAFFVALVLAGLTSSVSLLEVVVASIMDEFGKSRKAAAVGAGLLATTFGLIPAMSQNAFGIFDKVSGELMVVAGVLGMAILVGWKMKDPLSELREGSSPVFRRIAPGLIFTLRYVVPPLTAVVLWYSMKDTIALIFG